jgi:acetyl esterase/lipase
MTPDDLVPAPPRRARRGRWIALLVVLGVVALIVGGWAIFVRETAAPEPGAFYTPPDPLPAGQPGDIIRSEPIDGLPTGVQGWRVLYLSTGMDGEPIAVSGGIFAPDGGAPADGRPIVAWAHGTSGIVPACAPSIGDSDGGLFARIPSTADLVGAGYVVTATDYPGLGTPGIHPYLVGASEGQAVLDSVRAAQQLPEAGAGEQVAIWGHSQGGHAALFAGQMAPDYAPELELVGIAAAAPASELSELFQRDLNSTSGKLLTSFAVVSWSSVYPDAKLDQVLEPVAIPLVEEIAEGCILTDDQELAEAPAILALNLGFNKGDPTQTPPWSTLFTENTTASGRLAPPLLVTQGTADTIVWPDVTEGYVQKLCAVGSTVELKTYEGVDHFGVRTASAPDVVAWLGDRFTGASAPSTCS